jgi:endoglucanase
MTFSKMTPSPFRDFRRLGLGLLFLVAGISSAAGAARLASLTVLDDRTLLLHIKEGIVTFVDDASGPTAFSGHDHEPRLNEVVRFGNLAVSAATTPGNWTLTSPTAAAYTASGRAPTAVHRKSKVNGMAEMEWTQPWDFHYEYTSEHFLYLRLPEPLAQGQSYTLAIPAAAGIDTATATFTFDIFESVSEAIKVNLVGYRADGSIKAVDLYAWMGDGGARDYSPYEGNTVYIKNVDTGEITEVGEVEFWKSSATETYERSNFARSNIWRADFTGFRTPGTYRIAIEGIGASRDFAIADDIYRAPFKVNTRGYFYMRIGQDSMDMTPVPRRPLWYPEGHPEYPQGHPEGFRVVKTSMHPWHPEWNTFTRREPHAKTDPWDGRHHHWAPYILEGWPVNPHAWGGWSDALDWDRNLAHVSSIYDLLLPFILTNGALADDDLGIAESGNGIPDLLDEARYEVDFFLRLKDEDGYSHGVSDIDRGANIAHLAAPTGMAAWANAANAAMLADAFRITGRADLMAHYRDAAMEAFQFASALSAAEQMLDVRQNIGEGFMRGRDFRFTAAAFLYNVTGDPDWEAIIEAESVVRATAVAPLLTTHPQNSARNQIYGTAAYLFSPQPINFPDLQENMRTAIVSQAFSQEANHRLQRPSRRSVDNYSGYFITVQNVHRSILAHAVATDPADRAELLDALVLEADWGLGRNPLGMIKMTTASTSLGHIPSVEASYTSGRNDGTPGLHPGHTPYMNMYDWDSSMIMGTPSNLYNRGYPNHGFWKDTWPRGELFYNTRYVWAHSEHTPQQTMRGKQTLYGYLYGISAGAPPPLEAPELMIYTDNGRVMIAFERTDDPRLTYKVWRSTDLIDWGVEPHWSGTGEVNGRVVLEIADAPVFLRLDVSRD